MKNPVRARSNQIALQRAATLLLFLLAHSARAQLAITEVMSNASTNRGPMFVTKQSDFWELTNFGTNAIDLTGYEFSDSDEVRTPLFPEGAPSLTIGPMQSIIFIRFESTTNEDQFRAWWGECLDASVPVSFYPQSPGLNSDFDGLRLWDASGRLVDRVDFGAALNGVTFISDTNTGAFGVYSRSGTCGTCQAATADDIGSPGTTCGPIPLQIVRQPLSQVACAGGFVALTAEAIGLPRPKYQWFFNGEAIPGAVAASYTITNMHSAQSGAYQVAVSNGLMFLLSETAMLTASTDPAPPVFLAPPLDAEVYTGQTARFSVSACAYPLASYQWLSNGVPIADATTPVLQLPNCTPDMSGAQFCVQVQNILGTNTACARLVVTPVPKLIITEVMPHPDPLCPSHADWFEISNQGTNPVNLLGYRFSDSFSFAGAFTITQAVSLLPGQSAIFVESMTAAEFRNWWGAGNLPPDLAIVTYSGFGLSDMGDTLYLWNAAAEKPDDHVTSLAFEGAADPTSWRFDEMGCLAGCESAAGHFGAFQAAECGEVGSPGYTTNGPPRIVSLARDSSGGARITWHGVEGNIYRLEYVSALPAGEWSALEETVATNSLMTRADASAANAGQRFYRVLQVSP